MRVVFDTKVFISVFAIPGGRAEEAYVTAIQGKFELFTSVAILTETANTLHSKFDWSDEKIRQVLQIIGQIAHVVTPQHTLSVLRDDPDNRILECALAAQAEVIVTGYRHLLALETYHGIRILKLAVFLNELQG